MHPQWKWKIEKWERKNSTEWNCAFSFLNCNENHYDWRKRTIKSFVIELVEIDMNVQHAAYNAHSRMARFDDFFRVDSHQLGREKSHWHIATTRLNWKRKLHLDSMTFLSLAICIASFNRQPFLFSFSSVHCSQTPIQLRDLISLFNCV